MTDEDKKRIAEYMKWKSVLVGPQKSPYPIYVDNIDSNIHHRFDLNDAGLCVEKMREKGDWSDFYFYFVTLKVEPMERSIFEMFNAENFFSAMAAMVKERKEK